MPEPAPSETSDWNRVHLRTDFELAYWRRRFAVSEEALLRAVERVGPDVDAVQRESGGRR